jgi:hypothetical protein
MDPLMVGSHQFCIVLMDQGEVFSTLDVILLEVFKWEQMKTLNILLQMSVPVKALSEYLRYQRRLRPPKLDRGNACLSIESILA